MSVSRRAAIAGIGQTEFSTNSGRSELQLAAESIRTALDDAGIPPSQVDGLITFTLDSSDEIGLSRCLGCENIRYTSRIPGGGAASVATLAHAAAVVAAGVCENVVIWRAMNERSEYRFGQPSAPGAVSPGGGTSFIEWCVPFGAQTPGSWAALAAGSYMTRYGATNEDFGRLSVAQRAYAATNPAARFFGKPIRLEDHQNSRWVAEPVLRLLDCCQESDGGVALVVTSAARARDLRRGAVEIVAVAQSMPFEAEVVTNYYHHGDLAKMQEALVTAASLYEMSGLGPRDFQVAMLYDAFTPLVLMQLEAFGFCDFGEAPAFIRDGHVGPGGTLPINTHGGLLGEAYIHGMNTITEAVRQVRGTAANQVRDVEHVLVSSAFAGAILARGR